MSDNSLILTDTEIYIYIHTSYRDLNRRNSLTLLEYLKGVFWSEMKWFLVGFVVIGYGNKITILSSNDTIAGEWDDMFYCNDGNFIVGASIVRNNTNIKDFRIHCNDADSYGTNHTVSCMNNSYVIGYEIYSDNDNESISDITLICSNDNVTSVEVVNSVICNDNALACGSQIKRNNYGIVDIRLSCCDNIRVTDDESDLVISISNNLINKVKSYFYPTFTQYIDNYTRAGVDYWFGNIDDISIDSYNFDDSNKLSISINPLEQYIDISFTDLDLTFKNVSGNILGCSGYVISELFDWGIHAQIKLNITNNCQLNYDFNIDITKGTSNIDFVQDSIFCAPLALIGDGLAYIFGDLIIQDIFNTQLELTLFSIMEQSLDFQKYKWNENNTLGLCYTDINWIANLGMDRIGLNLNILFYNITNISNNGYYEDELNANDDTDKQFMLGYNDGIKYIKTLIIFCVIIFSIVGIFVTLISICCYCLFCRARNIKTKAADSVAGMIEMIPTNADNE